MAAVKAVGGYRTSLITADSGKLVGYHRSALHITQPPLDGAFDMHRTADGCDDRYRRAEIGNGEFCDNGGESILTEIANTLLPFRQDFNTLKSIYFRKM